MSKFGENQENILLQMSNKLNNFNLNYQDIKKEDAVQIKEETKVYLKRWIILWIFCMITSLN